ncbi:MAG: hypothetical protein ACK4JE_01670 [Endomicrobiia bacterium]
MTVDILNVFVESPPVPHVSHIFLFLLHRPWETLVVFYLQRKLFIYILYYFLIALI